MCGIVGILSTKGNARQYLLEGIEILQNRGYDSAGVAVIKNDNKELEITKLASDNIKKIDCITKLKEMVTNKYELDQFNTGIGHTRWATCGGKTDQNAHPHNDFNNRLALVHNGTLDDVQSLRNDIVNNKKIQLKSETDTEIIAQYIGYYLSMDCNMNILDAATKTMNENLKGTWGLVVIDKVNPHQMLVARHGSPLLIGFDEDSIYVASERIAFEKYTQNYISLDDGEAILLDLNKRHQFFSMNKKRINVIKEKVEVLLNPIEPYRFFFEQEINQQPEAILKCMGNGSRLYNSNDSTKLGGLEINSENIKNIHHLLIIGCGSSYFAGQFACRIFKLLKCFQTIQVIEASEFTQDDLMINNCGAIFISQSGETADIYKALQICLKNGLFCIGIVNTVSSLIAKTVNCGVYVNCGREVSVPATKSFTCQVVTLIMSAIFFSKLQDINNIKYNQRVQLKNYLRMLPVIFGETIMSIQSDCQKVADAINSLSVLIILAKGSSYAIAKEGALKIKETTYIQAEAICAGEMKHGPIALIEPSKNTKIILIILDNEQLNEMILALSEMNSREAFTIVITDCLHRLDQSKIDLSIQIINTGELTPLVCVLPFQIISYQICLIKGLNPDKPRNLAKTVTVS